MTEQNGFAVASELGISIRSANDVSDALVACTQHDGLLLTESELCTDFFDLRTGLAGEALQKFVNYGARVAIVVEKNDSYGDRFRELMHEHRTHPFVRFFPSGGEAETWLRRSGP
jgi:hypothetical protein